MPDLIIPKRPVTVSKLEFMNKLTNDELIAIFSLAKTDPVVEVWVEYFKASEKISLGNNQTISGLEMLVTKGILTSDRINEILGK